MRYENTRPGIFLSRPNRFTAWVVVDGVEERVHVKNTGRCRELLIPGAEVWLTRAEHPARKTKYDLIAVRKKNGVLFNIDSQAPNQVVREWLEGQGFDRILPEYRFGQSRIDFCLQRGAERWLLEVKGCTLERDGIGFFPDAPTARGAKHLQELTAALSQGWHAAVAFVMQADGMKTVLPNAETDPVFAAALTEAEQAGVRILSLPCHAEPDRLEIIETRGL
ncbi:MAG: DNA/RNA nuclease SfsA [Oscillospiraceae bacterium]|nr:DNA/RNA nuclease SfsA [Oscillospiraceae bacterium]MBR4655950.1 DNA/RNA nuclease SfsA [Oscillospiraceae bacterium]